MKPVWWPHEIIFSDVNNNPRPRRKDLLVIMKHFREWKKRQLGTSINNDNASQQIVATSTPLGNDAAFHLVERAPALSPITEQHASLPVEILSLLKEGVSTLDHICNW